jgi:hypothetical protein
MKTNPSLLLLGLLSYLVGLLAGLFLIVVSTWADMESTFYGFERLASAGLKGVSCPILMTRAETGTISFDISNSTERRISPSIKTALSTPVLSEEFNETIDIAPGETRRLEWAVGPQNVDLERFIFAKVLLYSSFPLPSREATCGIFVLNLPGSGRVILSALVLLSLAGMGWGLHRLSRFRSAYQWVDKHMGSLMFLAALIVLGLGMSFAGGWISSMLVLVAALLIIVILLSSWILGERTHHR